VNATVRPSANGAILLSLRRPLAERRKLAATLAADARAHGPQEHQAARLVDRDRRPDIGGAGRPPADGRYLRKRDARTRPESR
jgi:hypothetical protein